MGSYSKQDDRSRLGIMKRLGTRGKELLSFAIKRNRGIIVVDNLYNDPSVKCSYYSVLSGDQSHIDHRDPRKMAEIAEALSALECEGLIGTLDTTRAIFRVTAKGERFITGAKFPTKRELRYMVLCAIWIASLVVGTIILLK